ncbi:restriction endonuclease subunit S [Streptomyces hirsutus]|uniref:restriction endonuclease subunit S n=1 Tax=Streptomyces hirsutus TaxID=35620 RepID=UPI00362CDF2D
MADQGLKITFTDLIGRGTLEIGDGYRAKNSELGGDGPIFMRAGRLTRSGWDWDGAERFHADLTEKVEGKLSLPQDTVITTKGNSVGRTGYVPHDVAPFVYSPHLSYWRSRKIDELDPGYLRYWALSPEFAAQLKAMAHGTDMAPYLSLYDQKHLSITLPTIERQRAIAEVLGALDDKIAVNERIANTSVQLGGELLELAIQAHSYESTVGSIAELVYGKALPEPKRRHGDAPVYGCTGQVGWHDTPLTPFPVPVVGRKGANAGHVSWMSRPGWVIDTAYYARPLASEVSTEALYFVLNSAGLKKLIGDSAVPGVNRDLALRQPVRLPAPGFMVEFREQARYLLETSVHKETENRSLAALRDTLLPQMVTGKLRIKDAERAVEDAV